MPIGACVCITYAVPGMGRILTLPRVLLLLKRGPGAHLKANRHAYQTALSKKMARIERIHELWTQMLGLICRHGHRAQAFFTIGSSLGPGLLTLLPNGNGTRPGLRRTGRTHGTRCARVV